MFKIKLKWTNLVEYKKLIKRSWLHVINSRAELWTIRKCGEWTWLNIVSRTYKIIKIKSFTAYVFKTLILYTHSTTSKLSDFRAARCSYGKVSCRLYKILTLTEQSKSVWFFRHSWLPVDVQFWPQATPPTKLNKHGGTRFDSRIIIPYRFRAWYPRKPESSNKSAGWKLERQTFSRKRQTIPRNHNRDPRLTPQYWGGINSQVQLSWIQKSWIMFLAHSKRNQSAGNLSLCLH